MSEALTPRWEDGINFYYPQEDYLKEKSISRKWDYNIIRPNAIIGFTPGCKYSLQWYKALDHHQCL